MAASVSAVRAGIEPIVLAAGVDLEDLSIQQAGRREIVRVVVDRDGGIDLDLVAGISQQVSAALECEPLSDEFAGTYVLEVTSPGVDRPLTQARHWRRAVDRLVEVHLGDGSTVVGRILSVTDGGVVLDVEQGRTSIQRTLAFVDIDRGRVQIEFNRSTGASDVGTAAVEGDSDGH